MTMKWSVDWTPTAIDSLQRIPWRDADRVATAVYRLAETGEGALYVMPDDLIVTARLRVGPYRVRMTRDVREHVLRIWWVYRA
ncbi:type II toxin-antitoxin system RelE family toxin [Sorangium sp. So ce1153]|uniref:type II toxin-antitoxin system RelE family toxin n=1 Tax=Sorangium sp. So ce1153 TaxID=3133333 RepID=UPI003F6209AA